jgi:hypothetical protein
MAKSKSTDLLLGFVEQISWRVMDEYPKIVQQMIRHRSGVYALYHQEKLYYVGLAKNLMGRLKGHLKDRHRGAWGRFSVYLTVNNAHMKQLESLLLRIAKPSGNRVSGGFGRNSNLYRELHRMMSNTDADRRAGILGGHVARRRRAKAATAKGSLGLAGQIERSMALIAHYKGRTYRASLRKSGYISYRGKRFESPSAAASKILGRAANGWRFWHYRISPGKWVPLANIRR